MEDYWEENDIISKLLDQQNLDESAENLGEFLSKSLHDEFEEIGENYNVPAPVVKRFSVQNIMTEFNHINKVVEEEIKQRQSSSSLEKNFSDEQIDKHKEEKNLHEQIKVLKPPPGIPAKPSYPIMTIDDVMSSDAPLPSNGGTINTKSNSTQKKLIPPPPGFLAKPHSATSRSNSSIKSPQGFVPMHVPTETKIGTSLRVNSTSTSEQSSMQAKQLNEVAASNTSSAKPSYFRGANLKPTNKRKSLKNIMSEFNTLSSIMDREMLTYELNLTSMKEQKQYFYENIKEAGRVDMLKTLHREQQEEINLMEKKHQKEIQSLLAGHKKDLAEAAQMPNSASSGIVSKSNQDLKIEFNEVLNEREEEIDNLNAMVHDLQYELESFQGGSDDIAMENEELTEKIQIKDEYIATLKLQLTNYEKLHAQDEWKLQQADDNLEMVEREQDEVESKAMAIMKRLRDELFAEQEKNNEIQQYIQNIHQKIHHQAEHNHHKPPSPENLNKGGDKLYPVLTKETLAKAQEQYRQTMQHQEPSTSIHNKTQQYAEYQRLPPHSNTNSDELCPSLKEKLAKMALRSISNVSRASSMTLVDSTTKTSPLLKSLGWFAVEANR